MADWERDGKRLRANLKRLLDTARDDARRRAPLNAELARHWQQELMRGLKVPAPQVVGRFRGEAGLEDVEVEVAGRSGVAAAKVARELAVFDRKLHKTLTALDRLIPPGHELAVDSLAAVVDLCAWAHAEWVRIHPLVNGNGRTARLWANAIAMRYGVPPFVRLRPRPDGGYGAAAAAAMAGDWQATAPVFRQMLHDTLRR